jgi:hypothetical protein
MWCRTRACALVGGAVHSLVILEKLIDRPLLLTGAGGSSRANLVRALTAFTLSRGAREIGDALCARPVLLGDDGRNRPYPRMCYLGHPSRSPRRLGTEPNEQRLQPLCETTSFSKYYNGRARIALHSELYGIKIGISSIPRPLIVILYGK